MWRARIYLYKENKLRCTELYRAGFTLVDAPVQCGGGSLKNSDYLTPPPRLDLTHPRCSLPKSALMINFEDCHEIFEEESVNIFLAGTLKL